MDAFAALADPVRRDLLSQLSDGATHRVVDLAATYDISRPAVSKHLRLLIDAELVSAETVGRERHYRATPAGLRPVVDYLTSIRLAAPPVTESMLDGLDLEVRRTSRDHRRAADAERTSGQQGEVG